MAVKVFIATTMRSFTNRNSILELEGNYVKDIINNLLKSYPDAGKALFDEDNSPINGGANLRQFINIFVNDDNINDLEGIDTKVNDNDEITFLPVIAGGAPTESIIPDERRKSVLLDDKEIDRYSKHLMLREVGVKGQKRIKAAKVLIIGLGALGSPVALYLAASGVGTIGLADFDEVAITNLQNQIAHGTRDVNRPKTASVKDSIRAINPLVKVEIHSDKIAASNIEEIISNYDIIVDATDNYPARYLIKGLHLIGTASKKSSSKDI